MLAMVDESAPGEIARLTADRDDWRRRCLEAEQVAEELAGELATARGMAQDAAREAAQSAHSAQAARAGLGAGGSAYDSVLDQDPVPEPSLAADGSDPGILPLLLASFSLVGLLVVALAAFNGRLLSVFAVFTLIVSVVLGYYARQTWQRRGARVRIEDGVVVLRSRDGEHRFDLTREQTRVEVHGEPGERGWEVVFPRRGLEDLVVTASMTDPVWFTEQLRRHRP